MRPVEHPDPIYQDVDAGQPTQRIKTSFPLHWYIFFGIFEPISVLGGVAYAVFLQQKCYSELVPAGYLAKIAPTTVAGAAQSGIKSFWKVATQESTGFHVDSSTSLLTSPTDMIMAQLGSCYFLIFLNSAIMLYFIRKYFSHAPAAQEKVLYAFFFVLGAADWTHILLTIHYLPAVSRSTSPISIFASKLFALADPNAWNSLLFGNTIFTFILFAFRAAWWVGIARDSFTGSDFKIDGQKKVL